MNSFSEVDVTDAQANAIARGMLAVAHSEGGADERELMLIQQFGLTDLSGPEITVAEAAAVIETGSPVAEVFVKSCLLVAWVDNAYGDAERAVVERYATALGVDSAKLTLLEQDVKEFLLGSLARLANSEAVADVAKQLQAL